MTENSYPICGVFEIPDEDELRDAVSDFVCIPSSNENNVVPEPHDGSAPTSFLVARLEVLNLTTKRSMLPSSNKAHATLSDSRLTIACSKYGMDGNLTTLVRSTGQRALAAHRRRPQMLVAQIRYPWIDAVKASAKKGFAAIGSIQVWIRQENGEEQTLVMRLPANVDACEIGAELVRRAASFVHTHDEELRTRHGGWLENASSMSRIASGETVTFPESRPVSPSSARIGRSAP